MWGYLGCQLWPRANPSDLKDQLEQLAENTVQEKIQRLYDSLPQPITMCTQTQWDDSADMKPAVGLYGSCVAFVCEVLILYLFFVKV